MKMTELESFRYELEYKIIPKWYYKDPIAFINMLTDKGGKFFSDVYLLFAPPSNSDAYTENDFEIIPKKVVSDDLNMYIIIAEMPAPTAMTLCRRMYFCYEEKTKAAKYYTSEFTLDGGFMVCSWNGEAEHENYGRAPTDDPKEFRMTAELFLKYAEQLGE